MRGLYQAAGSMLVNQVHLEQVCNNLANLNTPGYKRNEVVYRSFPEILLYRTERAGKKATLSGPIGISSENIAVDETVIMHQPGGLFPTGRELDFALQGEGFFIIQTPGGIRYTRDGHFHLNAEGVLVNGQGFPVRGEHGLITLNTVQPYLDREGNFFVDGERIERLQIHSFAPGDYFWQEGYNLFRAGEDAAPEPVETPLVFQGYLEESNSELTRQMVDLVKVRRSYEAAQKVSQTYDRLLSRSANELGALG
jgi:flagellar basal-body rod protein FlgF